MAGGTTPTSTSTTPSDLLEKIKGKIDFVRSLVVDISENRLPVFSLNRFRTYCSDNSGNCCCSMDLPCGKDLVVLEKESHARRLDIMLRVLLIIQQLLQENKHGTKRDMYYMQPSIFLEQAMVDRAVNDICILFECSYRNIHVVPVGKGLVMGWLRFTEGDRKVDCIKSPSTAFPVPVDDEIKGIASGAEYILVVEKEAVFNRLANDKYCEMNNCIVITGRGYPDVSTRRFLHHLVDKLCLPVYCLVDSDPYGFDILLTYRFGSMSMAYDSKLLSVPGIQWLGLLPSDLNTYPIPNLCLLPLTANDKSKTKAMLKRCYLHREAPNWRVELEIMLQKDVKFEIEALSVTSFTFLSEVYIPDKVGALKGDQVEVKRRKRKETHKPAYICD